VKNWDEVYRQFFCDRVFLNREWRSRLVGDGGKKFEFVVEG
jgi:hypothetical protein